MLKKLKLIVLDIDRTLLTDDYRLLPEVVEAVSRAKKKGLKVILATGRSPQSTQWILLETGISGPTICFNGAWMGTLGSHLPDTQYSFAMPAKVAQKFITEAQDLGYNPCWYNMEGCFALSDGPLVERETEALGIKIKILDQIPDEVEILKITCLEPSKININFFLRGYSEFFSIARSDKHLIEVTALGVSKKAALEDFARTLKISRNEICAVGDSENDLELISWVGTGIAMGNAIDAVKAIAASTTRTNQDGGAAHAIDMLINSETLKKIQKSHEGSRIEK